MANDPSVDPCFDDESSVELPTICLNELIPVEEPHEPPMGFEDGSLNITWDLELIRLNQNTDEQSPRPFAYVLADETKSVGHVAVLRILAERSDGHVRFTRYIIPEDVEGQLQIWLQQLKQNGTPNDPQYEDRSALPQIVLKGNNLLLETDKQLRAGYATFKRKRRFGYEHPGFARHFRIARWAVVNSDGDIVTENNDPDGQAFADEGHDGYHIFVSFHHIHHEPGLTTKSRAQMQRQLSVRNR